MEFRPFKAVRPREDKAEAVASLPYDVMNAAEAREMAEGNPDSFLRVDKAEIELDPSTDPYSDAVYEKAAENLRRLVERGVLIQDDAPRYYLYRLTWKGRSQLGFVGCPSADAYLADRIKKHELTRAEKERDRIRHVDTLNANTGPIFLTFQPDPSLARLKDQWTEAHSPVYDFTADDGVRHEVWIVDEDGAIDGIRQGFEQIPALYIADGHHRCASAVRVAEKRRAENPGFTGAEEFNYFLAVAFPADELRILDYNRVVRDLKDLSEADFLSLVSEKFLVEDWPPGDDGPIAPVRPHTFAMYLNEKWRLLTALDGTWDDGDPVEKLDVSILQNNLLAPILGIEDPRTDHRIDFTGGIRGLQELERRCRLDAKVAFALYPTSVEELMDIADAGKIMPPKSTWFEPKLRSGLFIHELRS